MADGERRRVAAARRRAAVCVSRSDSERADAGASISVVRARTSSQEICERDSRSTASGRGAVAVLADPAEERVEVDRPWGGASPRPGALDGAEVDISTGSCASCASSRRTVSISAPVTPGIIRSRMMRQGRCVSRIFIPLLRAGGEDGGAPLHLDDLTERLANVLLVVDDEHAGRQEGSDIRGSPGEGARRSASLLPTRNARPPYLHGRRRCARRCIARAPARWSGSPAWSCGRTG